MAQDNGGPPEDASGDILLQDFTDFFDDLAPIEISLRGKGKTLDLPGEDFRFLSPGLKATLTNLDDPSNTVDINVTGTITQRVLEDGSVETIYTGHNLVVDPFADDGGPGLFLITGHFSTVEDADGNLVQPLEGTGQMLNLLDMLL
jgi:hypothetical protein